MQSRVFSAYLDDLIIFRDFLEKHKECIELIFKEIRLSGMKINLDNVLFKLEKKYLGFIVGTDDIRTNQEKMIHAKNRKFLGLKKIFYDF